ncbi:MAG: response regulator [Deltaproteobacteria bacterium]|nr:response regulator [Deltaproteobacteria bacterium]
MSKVIMAVDDSTSIRQMVGFILRDAGYEVIEAIDGQDGVNHLLNNSGIDMIITDLNMPNMDGIELIKQARAMPKYKYIPIVMLTTESQDNKKQAGKAAGATGWIVKPFQPDQLLAVIRKVLR